MTDRLGQLLARVAVAGDGGFDGAWPEAVVLLGLAPLEEWLVAARHASANVRAAAAAALAHRPEAPAHERLTGLLGDVEWSVRREVAVALATRQDVPDHRTLHELLTDGHNEVRAAIVPAAIRHPGCLDQVLALLQVPSFTVRRAASLALAELADEDVASQVVDLLAVEGGVHTLKTLDLLAARGALPLMRLPEAAPPVARLIADCQAWGLVHLQEWLKRPDRDPSTAVHGKWEHAGTPIWTGGAGAVPVPAGLGDEAEALAAIVTAPTGRRSVALVGETGVGKTALVHAVAHVLGRRGWMMVRIAPGELMADHQYLGQWQGHLKRLLTTIRRPAKIVLYVPGVEGLCWTGRASDSKDSLGSMLRPFVEDGAVAVLGEANPVGWQIGLGDQSQLLQAFTMLELTPASDDRTAAIAEEMIGGSSDVRLVVTRASNLSKLAYPGMRQPGRTLRLLEDLEAIDAEVSASGLIRAVTARTGLPSALLDDDEPLDLSEVRRHLESRVMGQPDAVDAVVDALALIKAGLVDPDRPNAIMLFVGPTGVGKTELARALATWMFGSPDRLLRFDMSEYASYNSYERLIAAGTSAEGSLVRAVQAQPFSVVLLDEIEKAHVNVFDLLLQVFDAGRMTDTRGVTTDFRSTVIIVTSNVGAQRLAPSGEIGFVVGAEEVSASVARLHYERALAQSFRPEFIGRLDRTVVFAPLSVQTATRIAQREIADVLGREGLVRRDVAVDVDRSVVSLCLAEGYSAAYGARPLRQVVARKVLLPVARVMAERPAGRGTVIRLVAEGSSVRASVMTERQVRSATGAKAVPALAALHDGLAAVDELADPLRTEKSTLLLQSAAPTFWEDRGAALAVLDRIHRLDRVLSDLRRLERDLERTERNPNQHLQARYIAAHSLTLARLQSLMRTGSLEDAFVSLTQVGAAGGLGGLALLRGMYERFATRHGFDLDVVHDSVSAPEVILLIGGPGAHTLLAGEGGLHRITEGRGANRQTEHVRVAVMPVPAGEPTEQASISRARTLKGVSSATGAAVRTEVTVAYGGGAHMVLTSPLPRDALQPLARLLVQAHQGPGSADDDGDIARRYDLGPRPLVRDTRTGRSTGRLADVFDGLLELLSSPAPDPPS
ncbi:MAG TPA: AAA family ATPase [Euzebya sp.]|nr:AAA family ATPase [Euzebya sp.]